MKEPRRQQSGRRPQHAKNDIPPRVVSVVVSTLGVLLVGLVLITRTPSVNGVSPAWGLNRADGSGGVVAVVAPQSTVINKTVDLTPTMTGAFSATAKKNVTDAPALPEWLYEFQAARQRIFLATIEPVVVALFGPVEVEEEDGLEETTVKNHFAAWNESNPLHASGSKGYGSAAAESLFNLGSPDLMTAPSRKLAVQRSDEELGRRRLLSWPGWHYFFSASTSHLDRQKETNFSFATLLMLFVTLNCVFLIFLSCFYHNQKTSPLFISPRRHRLPKLVPPPLPVDGYFSWVKVCLFISDEEIINRVGYDSLIFIRFHRLALRCIVKMSIFSFVVLLPLNFTGNPSGSNLADQDIREMLFFTNFMLFTMANIGQGSPRLWVHCFAAYLLTGIVIRELLIEYETFNSIRHRYLLSREPHLRTVLVTNIPRHLRSGRKITSYFRHVYPNAVHSVFICQNVIRLEALIRERTAVLARIEKELLVLCRTEKRKLYEQGFYAKCRSSIRRRLEDEPCCYCVVGPQERLANLYSKLDDLNAAVEAEQTRRRKVMRMLDHMEAGEGAADIDYVLASPFIDGNDAKQRRVLGLASATLAGSASHPPPPVAGPYQPPAVPTSTFGTSTQEMSRVDPELGRHKPASQRPDSIPEGNEDDDQRHRPPNVAHAPPVASFDENQSVVSVSQLRSRSPATSTANPDRPESTDDANRPSTAGAAPSTTTTSQAPATAAFSTRPTVTFDDEVPRDDENEGVIKENVPSRGMRRGLRSFAKAKQAIRRYGRFNRQRVSFLGRPIYQRSEAAPPPVEGHIEDHINEVTDKAFVVMRTFTAATIAIQSMHSSKPGSMQVSTAPEPRDILWKNIYVSKGAHRTRSFLGETLVLIIILFYAFPVTLISFFTSDSALKTMSPRLSQLAQASSFFSAAIALVQPLCIVGLQQLLPPLFMFIGEAEGILSFSEVQMRAFSRYFLFQVINVFLVLTITTSVFDTVASVIESPEVAFQILGLSLPKLSSFFITFITVKTFLALGFELVRTMSLVQAVLRYFMVPNATLRTQRTVMAGMRAIDDPGWFPFHKILAQDMLVVVVSVVFAVIAPLVLLPCAIFCLYSRIMWTHHHLYVYESVFESGGQFWPKIFRRFVFGLIIAQMTITGQFILNDARHEAYATIALMVLTYFFLRSTRARYDATSSSLPLEVATVMDISLHQEEVEAQRHLQQQLNRRGNGPVKMPLDPGAMIGSFDPFRKAYQQPALRANPRARPEQPFPAAQLGREGMASRLGGGSVSIGMGGGGGGAGGSIGAKPMDMDVVSPIHADDSTEDDWQDSGATVRLKCLNQQDRRLINRWWNDQLQRAGDQKIFSILIGEECGTLTLSSDSDPHPHAKLGLGASSTAEHDQASMFASRSQSMV